MAGCDREPISDNHSTPEQGEGTRLPPVSHGPAAAAESPAPLPAVPFRAAVPGLAAVVALEAAYWLGAPSLRAWLAAQWPVWMPALLALPMAYLLLARRPPAALGYRRERALGFYMRGVAAGALWRLFSILTSFYGWWSWLGATSATLTPAGLAWMLILVPLVEETFFRGYLQAGLEARLGPTAAIVLQALLFALHPAHAAQGWPAFPSILLYGLLAGVLYWRSRSIWVLYGAHGIANLLPGVVLLIAHRLY